MAPTRSLAPRMTDYWWTVYRRTWKGSVVSSFVTPLLYVLAMVVIGGLVGAGALGYDVVLGFSRSEEWGKGAAAGITIVLLGVMVMPVDDDVKIGGDGGVAQHVEGAHLGRVEVHAHSVRDLRLHVTRGPARHQPGEGGQQ